MSLQTQRLLLPEDLEDEATTSGLTPGDRESLRSVSKWVKNFVACPHRDLGREGTVCPFVPGSLERRALFLTPEHVAGLDTSGVARLMDDYKQLFLKMFPLGEENAIYSTIIVVFTDLPPESAGALFSDVLERLAVPSYEEDGILFGPFHEGNEGTAIYNADFHPFQSPSPFLFVRHTVVSDWKFFLEDDASLNRWARRFGTAATVALAEELRHLPWRTAP
jgi:hypothetical protein